MFDTFDILSPDGFDGYFVISGSIISPEYLTVLSSADFSVQDIVIYKLGHAFYIILKCKWII